MHSSFNASPVKLLLGLVLLALATVMPAQTSAVVLSHEEMLLIEAFRANPAAFRAVMVSAVRPPTDGGGAFVGPRDVIDVSVSGGKIAFYGKRAPYEPAAIRLARGEEASVVFVKQGSNVETAVKVSFRSDGLHFDVPRTIMNRTTPERGLIVIREDPRWRTGEVIRYDGPLDNWRSVSEAERIEFSIRYVASR